MTKKKTAQSLAIEARNFWLLASVIRRGRLSERSNRRIPLKAQEMFDMIHHFLSTFTWSAPMLERIAELQTIAQNKMDKTNEQAHRRQLRTASK